MRQTSPNADTRNAAGRNKTHPAAAATNQTASSKRLSSKRLLTRTGRLARKTSDAAETADNREPDEIVIPLDSHAPGDDDY